MLRLTENVGVDIVVDVVGGADLLHSVASLRYGGRIALLGLLDKEDGAVSLTQPLLYGGKTSESLRDLPLSACFFLSFSNSRAVF